MPDDDVGRREKSATQRAITDLAALVRYRAWLVEQLNRSSKEGVS